MPGRDESPEEGRRERKKTRKPSGRPARREPRRGSEFFEQESEGDAWQDIDEVWEESAAEADLEEDLSYKAALAAAEKIEAEGTPAEDEAELELEARDEDLGRFESSREVGAPGEPSGRQERPAMPERRVRRPARGGTRRMSSRDGFPLALPLATLGALVTLILTIVFTKFSKIDYSDLVFWLVIFTLAAFFYLKLRGGGRVNVGFAPLLGALVALPVKLPTIPYGKITGSGCAEVVWVFLLGTIITMIVGVAELTKADVTAKLIDFTGVGFTALIFFAVMKILPQKPELTGHYTPALLVSVGIGACVLYVFYLGRSAYILAQDGQFSAGAYLQSVLRKSWFPFFTLGFVGVFMGLVFVGIGMWSVLVILPLLLVFIYAYSRVAATDQYLLETIGVLSTIPEETGMIEKGHAERVTALSVDVARELGLSPEDTKQVEYAALLHDIGAITRKGAPGEQELQLMEAEGVIAGGVDILGQVDYLEVAAEILRGREGLRDRVVDVDKRRAVSLGAGILRAVDDFESLIRGSETREPLSEHNALTEMNLERGVRYDSKVLRAIARVYPRIPQEGFEPRVGAGPEESDFWSEQ